MGGGEAGSAPSESATGGEERKACGEGEFTEIAAPITAVSPGDDTAVITHSHGSARVF